MLGIRKFAGTAVDLYQGDITQFACDALVNAANTRLAGGGGVDGAIHRAGGPSIMEECRKFDGCPTGDAVTTGAGNLPAEYVIHTVGPVWSGGNKSEDALLASAHRRSLEEAAAHGVRHVAFPALSTGAYRFPVERAARVAMEAVKDYLSRARGDTSVARITFVLFDKSQYDVFQNALFQTFPEDN